MTDTASLRTLVIGPCSPCGRPGIGPSDTASLPHIARRLVPEAATEHGSPTRRPMSAQSALPPGEWSGRIASVQPDCFQKPSDRSATVMSAPDTGRMSRSARDRLSKQPLSLAHRQVSDRSDTAHKHLPPVTIVPPCGSGIRRSRVKYAGSGDSTYRSDWSKSQSYRTMVTSDSRWDHTVSR